MTDKIRGGYRRIYLSPSPLQFDSPWRLSVDLSAIDTTCNIMFEQVDFQGKAKIGPGKMDAQVRYVIQMEKSIEVEGLHRKDRGDRDTEETYTFNNEDEVRKKVKKALAPVADFVTTLITGRIGHVFLQEYPHSSVYFIHDSVEWGGIFFRVQHGELTASISSRLQTDEIETDLKTLQSALERLTNIDRLMKSEFFLGSLLNRKPIGQFILAFAGLESLIHYGIGDTPAQELNELFTKLLQVIDDLDESELKEKLREFLGQKKGALTNPNLEAKFTQLSSRLFNEPDEVDIKIFQKINKLRNDILHGRTTAIKGVPLFTRKGFTADNPVSNVQMLYLKYLRGLLYERAYE